MDPTPSVVEIWTLYTIGSFMIFARAYCRTRLVGFRGYAVDDYLIWATWLVYTDVAVLAHVFVTKAGGLHTSLLTTAEREALPTSDYAKWIYGSKNFVGGQISYVLILWLLKLNMLFFYRRITNGLWVEKYIMPTIWLVAGSFVVVLITLFCTCFPYHKMWQIMPDPGPLCVPLNKVVLFTMLAMNLGTDLCIVVIPLPILRSLKTTLVRKLGLYFVFSLGIFVMVAAILRVILVVKNAANGTAAMWAIREDFVAVFVGQASMVYPLFKRTFWHNTSRSKSSRYRSNEPEHSSSRLYEMGRVGTSKGTNFRKSRDPYSVSRVVAGADSPTESQEDIVKEEASIESGPSTNEEKGGGIRVHQTVHVETSDRVLSNVYSGKDGSSAQW